MYMRRVGKSQKGLLPAWLHAGLQVALLLYQCTDPATRALYGKLPSLMCEHFELCSTPFFWLDDLENSWTESLFRGLKYILTGQTSWRDEFAAWLKQIRKEENAWQKNLAQQQLPAEPRLQDSMKGEEATKERVKQLAEALRNITLI